MSKKPEMGQPIWAIKWGGRQSGIMTTEPSKKTAKLWDKLFERAFLMGVRYAIGECWKHCESGTFPDPKRIMYNAKLWWRKK